MPEAEPPQPFYLIVTDHDRGVFAVEGAMTDDRPWKEAAAHAGSHQRRIECGPAGAQRDFIFSRRRDIELECNYVLAGLLLTDIPKNRRVSKRDRRLISKIIAQLRERLENQPDHVEVGLWCRGAKPADGLSPPFDERLLKDRCRRCLHVPITSGTEVKVPSDLMRQMMGGDVH